MIKDFLISVIIPAYNIDQYIEKCLYSIQNQTYKNIEVIIIDDGSTDQTGLICDKFVKKDSRFKVIHRSNRGLVSARKQGVKLAEGEYVSFVDGDDWIDEEFYERVVCQMDSRNADIISYLGHNKDYEDGRCIKIQNNMEEGFYYKNNFEEQVFPRFIKLDEFYSTDILVSLWGHLFKCELIKEKQLQVPDTVTVGEDMDCVWRCIMSAQSINIIDVCGYHYVQRNNSMMHKNLDNAVYSINRVYMDCLYEIKKTQYSFEVLQRKMIFFVFFAYMITGIGALWTPERKFLFPYTKVKKGSRVLIYGAGILGQQIVGAMQKQKEYTIAGWVDMGWKYYQKQGKKVESPQKMMEFQYDVVIIAISRSSIAKQIKRDLVKNGIDTDKIAEVDESLFVESNIPVMRGIA